MIAKQAHSKMLKHFKAGNDAPALALARVLNRCFINDLSSLEKMDVYFIIERLEKTFKFTKNKAGSA